MYLHPIAAWHKEETIQKFVHMFCCQFMPLFGGTLCGAEGPWGCVCMNAENSEENTPGEIGCLWYWNTSGSFTGKQMVFYMQQMSSGTKALLDLTSLLWKMNFIFCKEHSLFLSNSGCTKKVLKRSLLDRKKGLQNCVIIILTVLLFYIIWQRASIWTADCLQIIG